MPRRLLAFVLFAALAVAALIWLRARTVPENRAGSPAARLPDLGLAVEWVNGGPMTEDSLSGRPVVLVVWSDTDPRSLELLPEVEAWHNAYARYGARVIGVHAPDFSFSADPGVTAAVARRMGLHFPIAFDPGYRIRSALGVEASPAIVVADGEGAIVHTAEAGSTAGVDRALRALVSKRRPDVTFPDAPGDGAVPPPPGPGRPVIRFVYLGTARVAGGPLYDVTPGRTQTFTTQFRFQEEGEPLVPYPVGRWTPRAEGLTAARGGAANFVALRTEGGRVDAVMGPPPEGSSRVWILDGDGWLAPEARDADVHADARGATYVEVDEPRLYAIARGGARLLKLSPESPGITFYGFAIEPK